MTFKLTYNTTRAPQAVTSDRIATESGGGAAAFLNLYRATGTPARMIW